MFFLVAVSTQHGEASLAWAAHGAVALRKHLKHVIEIRHRHKKAYDFGCADGLLLASVGARAGGLSQSGNSKSPAVTNCLTATLHRLAPTQHAPPPRRSLSRLEIECCAGHACVT